MDWWVELSDKQFEKYRLATADKLESHLAIRQVLNWGAREISNNSFSIPLLPQICIQRQYLNISQGESFVKANLPKLSQMFFMHIICTTYTV